MARADSDLQQIHPSFNHNPSDSPPRNSHLTSGSISGSGFRDKDFLTQARERAMQQSLKFQENRSLLQGEDVEFFFKNLETPEQLTPRSERDLNANSNRDISERKAFSNSEQVSEDKAAMFQNSMHAMGPMATTTPTYDATGVTMTSMSSGLNPVYVPTTRAVLPPMHYMTNGGTQGVSSPNSGMWPMNPADPTYSAANPHASVSPRFAFAPAPSSPISTPTARADSGFSAPLARPTGLNPYHSYMGTPEISSAWNFQMALQQGLRQTGPGMCFPTKHMADVFINT